VILKRLAVFVNIAASGVYKFRSLLWVSGVGAEAAVFFETGTRALGVETVSDRQHRKLAPGGIKNPLNNGALLQQNRQ